MEKQKKTVVVATGNMHKLREIAQIFPEYHVISQKEAGFDGDVEETGKTFSENSLIKAEAACRALGLPVIADDSGLCVNALGGKPGVYSARYAGEHGNDAKNRALLLRELKNCTDRTAYFESAISYVSPDDAFQPVIAIGRTYGHILERETGTGGFGYDCIFFSDDLQKSFGLATAEEKNSVSHRYRALMQLKQQLHEEGEHI